MKKIVLTGVQPTGMPHLGNYVGAIRPAILQTQNTDGDSFLFIADYHALNACKHDKSLFQDDIYDTAATWLACGLDIEKTTLYCQSDVPEIMEFSTILSNFCSKGLLNRAHSYKDKVAKNEADQESDPDKGINMGLYLYPLLMTADILTFNASYVPVGPDQVQHLEIARDIAQRFNHFYGSVLTIPEAKLSMTTVLPGLDERKMSKSYGNHIPLFTEEKKLQKLINKIKTDSTPPEVPKDPSTSLIFTIFKYFSNESEQNLLAEKYAQGISWGQAKAELFQVVNRELSEKREKYNQLMAQKNKLEEMLKDGASRARAIAQKNLKAVKSAMGKSW